MPYLSMQHSLWATHPDVSEGYRAVLITRRFLPADDSRISDWRKDVRARARLGIREEILSDGIIGNPRASQSRISGTVICIIEHQLITSDAIQVEPVDPRASVGDIRSVRT
jgi:hypothetical protein